MSDKILLGHGSGGRLMHDLIKDRLAPVFELGALDDSAVLSIDPGRLAFTTDSYVVDPIFFPGGDIGSLAINGTVNDLSVVGAEPLYITVGLIIEEGLDVADLERVLASMRESALEAGVKVVAGDTKVVQKGKADRLFINTSGIGVVRDGLEISGSGAKPGDKIIVSGPIGSHGVAVMAQRAGLSFNPQILSDTRPLSRLCREMLGFTKGIRAMRDPTRGGLATTLKEIAQASGVGVVFREGDIPIEAGVTGACELLGFDPLYVANEGILVAFVEALHADGMLEVMRANPYGRVSAIIGEAVSEHKGTVVLQTRVGGKRIVDMLSGEQLPRIC